MSKEDDKIIEDTQEEKRLVVENSPIISNEKVEEQKPKKSKIKGKYIFQIVLFSVLTVLGIIYILKDDPVEIFKQMSSANFYPLTFAILIVLLSMVLDGVIITILTKIFYPKYKYRQGIINSLSGQAIGVFAKGSAPLVQANTFFRQDVDGPQAGSILTMNLIMYQASQVLFSTVMTILGFSIMKEVPLKEINDVPIFIISIIGLIVQLLYLALFLLIGLNRGLHRFVLNSCINLLAKLKILKHPEVTREKLTIKFATYRIEIKRLLKNTKQLILTLFINVVKLFLLAIVPFFIFISLCGSELFNIDFFYKSLIGTSYTNICSSILTVGLPELFFQNTFIYFLNNVNLSSTFEPSYLASGGNIIWRALTFYIPFIVGVITLISYRKKPYKYKILSDTKTIYQMQLPDLSNIDDATKTFILDVKEEGKKEKASIIDRMILHQKFKNINKMIEDQVDFIMLEDDEADEKNEFGRALLSNVMDETYKLIDAKAKVTDINSEVLKDKTFIEKSKLKKESKAKIKQERKEAKERKKFEKSEKRFLKRNDKKITYDPDRGLFIINDEIEETKTEVSSDKDE